MPAGNSGLAIWRMKYSQRKVVLNKPGFQVSDNQMFEPTNLTKPLKPAYTSFLDLQDLSFSKISLL